METSSESRFDLQALEAVQANCFAAMPSSVIVGCRANLTGESMCMAGVSLDSESELFFLVRDGGINKLHSSNTLLSVLTVNFGLSENVIRIAPPRFLASAMAVETCAVLQTGASSMWVTCAPRKFLVVTG